MARGAACESPGHQDRPSGAVEGWAAALSARPQLTVWTWASRPPCRLRGRPDEMWWWRDANYGGEDVDMLEVLGT